MKLGALAKTSFVTLCNAKAVPAAGKIPQPPDSRGEDSTNRARRKVFLDALRARKPESDPFSGERFLKNAICLISFDAWKLIECLKQRPIGFNYDRQLKFV